MSARARFLYSRAVDLGGGSKARARAARYWLAPGVEARELALVAEARRQVRAMSSGTVGSALWRAGVRHSAKVSAHDRLYHLRQARAAGVIRCRVPR